MATIFLFKIETSFIIIIIVEFPHLPFHSPFKMSFMDASFMINYSRPEYDSIFVKKTLETIFGLGFIEEVREILITPTRGAPKFKKFYIYTIDDDHPAFMRLCDLINDYTFAAIVYKYEYDRRARKYLDRYWKVVYAPQWKTFIPYLMNEEQMKVFYPVLPWAPEADAAFEPLKTKVKCDCESCKLRLTPLYKYVDETKLDEELPPSMVRDNEEPKGPFKMVCSVNSPPTKEEIEEELDKEFDEPNFLLDGNCVTCWECNCPPCRLAKKTMPTITYDTEKDIEFPPPMVRDNEERKGPFKLVRSVNSPPTKEEIEEEKAAAVNDDDYWREYWKFHTPPKLVRSTNEIGILTDKTENENDELGAAIDKFRKPDSRWDNVPKPPPLFDWDTREQADKHRKTNCLF